VTTNPHLGVEVHFPDLTVDPVSESLLAALLARGMPPDAVRDDRTLDLAVLRKHGWWVEGSFVMGPPEK
jgi:hypothetical protein